MAGVLLVLAAIDVAGTHTVSGQPETDTSTGLLTGRGQNQRRSGLMWGAALGTTGAVLLVGSVTSLLWRRPVLEVGDAGLRLRIAGPHRFLDVPWDEITWVHSAADGDSDEVVPPRVLLVHVRSSVRYPSALWGATWDGNTLVVDADSWNRRPEDVAAQVDLALDAWRTRPPGGED